MTKWTNLFLFTWSFHFADESYEFHKFVDDDSYSTQYKAAEYKGNGVASEAQRTKSKEEKKG